MTLAFRTSADVVAAKPRLAVRHLALTNFRSYAQASLALTGEPVVLAGPNGAGKTNVLDAISLLSPGRGLRGAQLAEHTRKAPQAAQEGVLWAVAASVVRDEQSHEIGTGLVCSEAGSDRREVHLNGARAQSSADLAEIVQMVWLTPSMDRLFSDSASARRRFLDRLVLGFDPAHARRSLRYEQAMRERARLLRLGPRDPGWLAGLENEMAEAGSEIAIARASVVERLNHTLNEREQVGEFPCAQLALAGEADRLVAEKGADAVDALRAALNSARMRDAETRRTTVGPHVSDLAARHTAKRMDARDCSTGEQKALLVSIVLADAWELSRRNAGIVPILLLDEIAAHLDVCRRAALCEEILALAAQVWLTGTDVALFENLFGRADIFHVETGNFSSHE